MNYDEILKVAGATCVINGKTVLTINGLRCLANQGGAVLSCKTYLIDEQGKTTQIMRSGETPLGAMAVVKLNNGQEIETTISFDEFAGTSPIWKKSPQHMIKKVAESHALRQALSVNASNSLMKLLNNQSEDELSTSLAQSIERPKRVQISAKSIKSDEKMIVSASTIELNEDTSEEFRPTEKQRRLFFAICKEKGLDANVEKAKITKSSEDFDAWVKWNKGD